MNFEKLTKEQQRALHALKTTKVMERMHTAVDYSTGEIISNDIQTFAKTSTEPDFIKLYYGVVLAFNGISNIPIDFILEISKYITFANEGEPMTFNSTKYTQDKIIANLNIKERMYRNYIKRCKDTGLLIPIKGYQSVFEVNPFFIARGKWSEIKKLQANFDFMDGTLVRIVESTAEKTA